MLSQLLDRIDVTALTGDPDREVRAVVADSRQVKPGALFVAIRGMGFDGHDFIESALMSGAAAIVAETEAPETLAERVSWVQVADSEVACGYVTSAFFGEPSHQMDVLAVTGTNGKTTVAWILDEILRACGRNPGLMGTVETRFGDVRRDTIFTTPPSILLHPVLGEMRDAGCTHAILEASSHGLAMKRMIGTRVAVGGFTNLSRDHLDFHGSMEAYAAAKEKLFTDFAEAACFNIDDPIGAQFAERFRASGKRCLTVSATGDEAADFRVVDLFSTIEGLILPIDTAEGEFDVSLRMIGRHNAENAMVALGMAVLAGIPLEDALEGLSQAKGAPGRLERVDGQEGAPHVIVDYAHTPDALHNVLTALKPLTRGRLICVFGAGGDRDRGKRPLMAQVARDAADLVMVTSDNPRTEDPEAIVDDIVAEIPASELEAGRVIREVDRERAIYRAVGMAGPEDVVLIAGKGHETYQIVGEEVRDFDDRVVARHALAALAGEEGAC